MENYILRQYQNTDYEFVYEAKKNAYKKYVEQCWGNWNDAEQRDRFKEFINKSSDRIYIIMIKNKRIGFYQGQILNDKTYYIENICIIPEYQGKGIGTDLIKTILEKHSDKNIEIQYFKQNPVGNLYKRLGFVNNGETEFHYQMIKRI